MHASQQERIVAHTDTETPHRSIDRERATCSLHIRAKYSSSMCPSLPRSVGLSLDESRRVCTSRFRWRSIAQAPARAHASWCRQPATWQRTRRRRPWFTVHTHAGCCCSVWHCIRAHTARACRAPAVDRARTVGQSDSRKDLMEIEAPSINGLIDCIQASRLDPCASNPSADLHACKDGGLSLV